MNEFRRNFALKVRTIAEKTVKDFGGYFCRMQ